MKNPFSLRPSAFGEKRVTFIEIISLVVLIGWISPGQAQGADKTFQDGRKLFENTCADCHRLNGQGLPAKFPALDNNPFVVGDPDKVIDTVLNGRKGKLGQMPTWKETFKDQEIASILTYIRQAWSNKGLAVTADMVKKRRK